MDALELLKQDHEKVKELFEEVEGTEEPKQKKEIFKQIKKELETHAHIEEGVFYPAMEKFEELKDMVRESYEEHKQIKTLLREIEESGDNEEFEAKLQDLQENVEHHAEEEEEGKMFPQVRELMDEAELEELGQELETAKGKRSKAA
jgi:hemerythrin superfamily protein